jgi:hypothetical protein
MSTKNKNTTMTKRMIPIYAPWPKMIIEQGKWIENRGNGNVDLKKQLSFVKGMRTSLGGAHGGYVLLYETVSKDPMYKKHKMEDLSVHGIKKSGFLVGAVRIAAVVHYDDITTPLLRVHDRNSRQPWLHSDGKACGVLFSHALRFQNPIPVRSVKSFQGIPKIRDPITVTNIERQMALGKWKRLMSVDRVRQYQALEMSQIITSSSK